MKKTSDSISFDTMRLEGGMFVPDILNKAARGEFEHQAEADYGIPKGTRVQDEYSRAFQIARAQWKEFDTKRQRQDLNDDDLTVDFILEFLRDCLGYHEPTKHDAIELSGRRYPIQHLYRGHIPIVIAPHSMNLDDAAGMFAVEGGGAKKKTPFQLLQEFLNASQECTWGIVTNGLQIRLLRDSSTLTRPTFLEFDLETILGAARYPDFAACWRILHSSRTGQDDASCIWEEWRSKGQEQGIRIREGLRHGVTKALIALGNGFLQHRDNDELRQALEKRALTTDEYFQELLRLVYRFLFLFTVEDRTDDETHLPLLHPQTPGVEAQAARMAYADGYSTRRLRDRALRRSGFDRHSDLWQAQVIVFRGLMNGEPLLALPALGGLFAQDQCPHLDAAKLTNAVLLTVMRHLRWTHSDGGLAPVDYKNMGPEELGSVYESLLELVPSITPSNWTFGFIGITDDGSTAGNARKTSGSYYTPDSLVQELIKSALDPVIEDRVARMPENPTQAILNISVIDPACGSGHFLLSAARRLAERLAQLRAVDGAVKPQDYRHALREVIAHCIYGVDRNPMALELARTALWLEGYEAGRPLSFLEHHLVCGDALLGVIDYAQLAGGIPQAAYKALSGDDKAVCKELAARNKEELKSLKNHRDNPEFVRSQEQDILAALRELEAMPDDKPEQVAAKERAYAEFVGKAETSGLARAADLFVGTFLLPKHADCGPIPTTHDLLPERFGDQPDSGHGDRLHSAVDACRKASVLHWPIAFAQVFAQGGFDCVLANPPWERIKLQEEEFFATRNPDVATARNKAERGQRIEWLAQGMLARHLYPDQGHSEVDCESEKALYAEFISQRRTAEAASLYAHLKDKDGGRYPMTGVGDVNTYALFAETIARLVASEGRAGFIVPTGIATDDSTKAFFCNLVTQRRLASLFSFYEVRRWFKATDERKPFCLLTLGQSSEPTFVFDAMVIDDIRLEQKRFNLTAAEFSSINPNTLTCPTFRSKMDAEFTRKIYQNAPVLIREGTDGSAEKNPWGIRFSAMFHMSNDSHLFLNEDGPDRLPLYEAKMIHQFDHRWATYASDDEGNLNATDASLQERQDPDYEVQPRYWVHVRQVLARIADAPSAVCRAHASGDSSALLKAAANWIVATRPEEFTGKRPCPPRRTHLRNNAQRLAR